ncbi:lipopolysaccharide biosynthesis protein, partial [Mesorhizobium sp. M1A.F.Ca.IN.020.32.1.1]
MNAENIQFGRLALRGGLVTGGAQAIRMVIQFVSVVVLARLLAPEDFGLVASVSP